MSTFKSHDEVATHPESGTINCAKVINGKIWYVLADFHQKAKWMVYDVNTDSHSFVTDLANVASIPSRTHLYTLYNDNIYMFNESYQHGPMVFNTKTTNHSIQISNQSDYLEFSTICIEINGNVYLCTYAQCQIYNISKQQFGALQYFNNHWLRNIIYDYKQKQWIVISDQFNIFNFDLIKGKDITECDPICQIVNGEVDSNYKKSWIRPPGSNCPTFCCSEHANLLSGKTNVLYDNYIITISFDANNIFVLDLITGNSKKLNVLRKNRGRCHVVIVDHPNGITQSIIKQYIESLKNDEYEDNEVLFIPNDIQILIRAFCGDYYDKTIHLFEKFLFSGKTAHFSISLGFIINTFIKQQTNFEEDDEEKKNEEDKGAKMDEYDVMFDEMERINHEKEALIEEMMEEYKRLFEERLMLKNRLKMYENK